MIDDGQRTLRSSMQKDKNTSAGLSGKLEELKRRLGIGYEVKVEWHPGEVKFRDGRPLEEEVIGNTILLYTEDTSRADELLAHGFAEWLLNQHTSRYRLLINKLIELFEEIQYKEKEKIVDAITKLMTKSPTDM